MMYSERSYKGHIVIAIAYILFGLNIPAVKSIIGQGGITGLSVTFYRMVGAAALFWIATALIRLFGRRNSADNGGRRNNDPDGGDSNNGIAKLANEKVPPRDVGAIFIASLFCILLNQMPFIVGVSLTSPIDAAVITTLTPMITMVLAALFLREPITWLKVVGVLVGASGALLLILGTGRTLGQGGSVVGDLLCALSSLSFSIYLVGFKRLFTTYSPVALMRWMFLFAALLSLPVCWHDVVAVDYSTLEWHVWARLGFIVGGATFMTFFLLPIGQRYLRPTVLGMYGYLQPVVASLVAVGVGMGTFDLSKGIATALVFAGVWLVTQSRSRDAAN